MRLLLSLTNVLRRDLPVLFGRNYIALVAWRKATGVRRPTVNKHVWLLLESRTVSISAEANARRLLVTARIIVMDMDSHRIGVRKMRFMVFALIFTTFGKYCRRFQLFLFCFALVKRMFSEYFSVVFSWPYAVCRMLGPTLVTILPVCN